MGDVEAYAAARGSRGGSGASVGGSQVNTPESSFARSDSMSTPSSSSRDLSSSSSHLVNEDSSDLYGSGSGLSGSQSAERRTGTISGTQEDILNSSQAIDDLVRQGHDALQEIIEVNEILTEEL